MFLFHYFSQSAKRARSTITTISSPFTSPARQHLLQHNRAASTSTSTSSFAVAFDIDGVLYRGSQDIPEAKQVIEQLQQDNIPILFLTNGGGMTEAIKVQKLGERIGVENLESRHMFQSHTPMQQLSQYKNELVLAVGKDNAKPILEK